MVNDALRAELLTMAAADSAAITDFLAEAESHRRRFDADSSTEARLPWPWVLLEWRPGAHTVPAVRRVLDTTAHNTARLRDIVRQHGWPGRSAVGDDGADAAWLVLQHACSQVQTIGTPESLAFVRDCLPLLRHAVEVGEAHPRHFAAATDGLQRAIGAAPRYGVLDLDISIVNGVAVVRALTDLEELDQRRLSIGLPPLASDISRRTAGESLSPAGPQRPEPWPTPPA